VEVYLVGGAVRDELLGRPVVERDWVVVGATPEELARLGYQPVGRDFPVFLDPRNGEEYALARTERKQGHGYHGFVFQTGAGIALEEDLARRDLTINAMAKAKDGHLIDPYQGQRDLQARVLRHVSPAFAEDPVRVLRVARFAARFEPLGFSVHPETLALMTQIVASGEVDHLVPERVWAETLRALAEPAPGRFIEVLRECGALARVMPELDRLFGVPQRAEFHPEIDTGIHTLLSLEQAVSLGAIPRVRFAVLVHDLGKAETPRSEWPRHRGHEQHSERLVRAFSQRLRAPNDFRELAATVARYHTHCHRALALRPATVLKLLEALDAFRRPDRLKEFLVACEADARGRSGFEQRDYPQAELLRQAAAAAGEVTARRFVEAGERGPAIGQAMREERIRRIAAGLGRRSAGSRAEGSRE
jgi:tRNA nucleotidyltransferase (CCA-adding enzyme)